MFLRLIFHHLKFSQCLSKTQLVLDSLSLSRSVQFGRQFFCVLFQFLALTMTMAMTMMATISSSFSLKNMVKMMMIMMSEIFNHHLFGQFWGGSVVTNCTDSIVLASNYDEGHKQSNQPTRIPNSGCSYYYVTKTVTWQLMWPQRVIIYLLVSKRPEKYPPTLSGPQGPPARSRAPEGPLDF